ncbi:MAG: hypothetical protein NT136_03060 [Candidatus Moranbacteria bacterium]|nr:hypothetical protein [Candidatus Moranbacteria bacterium]
MGNENNAFGDNRIFIIFALFWVFLGWLGFILALAGFFYIGLIIAYFILAIPVSVYYFVKKPGFRMPKEIVGVSLFIFMAVTIFSFFATPTIFSGRDQGAISEAAVRLAQNHRLEFSTPASSEFFKIYPAPKYKFANCINNWNKDRGNKNFLESKIASIWCGASASGKALNFPGFYYTPNGNLVTQFPFPYISWLAIFYSLFGLIGLIVANAVLLFLFLLSFYILARLFSDKSPSLLLLLLTFTSFSFSWFFKFTLSENMALAILWISIFALLNFLRKQDNLNYFFYISSAFLLVFVRIEGILFLATGLAVIFFFSKTRDYIKNDLLRKIIIPLIILAGLLFWNFTKDIYFYKEMARALLTTFSSGSLETKAGIGLTVSYFLQVFLIYGLFSFFILGTIGIIYFLKKREWEIMVPLFIVLPSFWYLINSNISPDHPWMLRRFVFSILPAFIFYSILFLAIWKEEGRNKRKKLLFVLVIVILLLFNLPSFLKFATFSENKDLLKQTAELSQNFSARDLVLVDRQASGDSWAMISGPLSFLLGKNAVYFFNPSDLEKINQEKFNRTYLIVPEENIGFYENSDSGKKLKFFRDYNLKTQRLTVEENQKPLVILPDKKIIEVKGKIFEISRE